MLSRLRELLFEVWTDLRHSVRSLRRSPALSAATIVTLALAIGANTAIYSAVRAVILRPLPYADPDRLYTIWETNPDFKWTQAEAAPANMLDWKEQAGVFADVGGYFSFMTQKTLTGRGDARMLSALGVTGNFFDLLGVRALHGRVFRDAETWRTGVAPVVLPFRTWRDQFGSDASIVGRTIALDGEETEVAGVLPANFSIPGSDADLFYATNWDPAQRATPPFRRAHYIRVVARLKPEVTPAQADAALQTVARRLQVEYPDLNAKMGAGMGPLHDYLVGGTKLPLLVMFVAVGTLLLIASANIANLLVVRAAGREREAALRLALGAGRGHLVRRALMESAVFAAAGGAAGLVLGWWGTRALVALQPPQLLPVQDVGVSWNVIFFVALATATSALIFGAAPAVWASRRLPSEVLKDGGRGASHSRRARRLADALLVGQVALALALTVGAGLLVRSYSALRRVDPGFDPGAVLTAKVSLPLARYPEPARVLTFFSELERRAAALPGVTGAALASTVPLAEPMWSSQFSTQGREATSSDASVIHRAQTPGYQAVMGTRLIDGRLFTDADVATSEFVVLVNETLAKRFFPGESPIGQRVTYARAPSPTATWRTIVGVISDEHQTTLAAAPQPEFFEPVSQEFRRQMVLTVRTTGDPAALTAPLRRIVAEMDPGLALSAVRTMEGIRSAALARSRFLTTLLTCFAAVGLALAVVGVYGVVAQIAKQRTREVGIRLALGARREAVQWLMVRHGLALAAIGIAIGGALAFRAAGAIEALLFEVKPGDPITFAVVPLVLLAAAGVACWLPAARAARRDLTEVMRIDG